MKRIHLASLLIFLVFSRMVFSLPAEPEDINASIQNIGSLLSSDAGWSFSGIAYNESGERFPYFFQIDRHLNRFHGIATVLDGQTSKVLIYEENSSLIHDPEPTHWQVGNLFLRFNPINQSWIFGVKNKKKLGFNFKVDMLEQSQKRPPKKQALSQGINLLITQTGHLNGHLQLDEKEQFITAKKAWFRQLWATKSLMATHSLTSVLCEFDNGQSFYSVKIPEADALIGSTASWRSALGEPLAMSQFVKIQEKDLDLWQINLNFPKLMLSFPNLLNTINANHQLVAGRFTGEMPGFCTISKDEIA